ncbi:hypothetical protein SCUCBS95973_006737 [Sporothrix curviconia]|uniref:F-box domain-containing protein n=1 Tax=Sporothrix curviconia TaxID=1260050 RepID=A0ABP0C7X6_9PEZI
MTIVFTDLPLEVCTSILSYVTPRDLVSVSITNRAMHSYVENNKQLHRLVYCNYFDKPSSENVDWEQQIHDFRRLRNICHSTSKSKDEDLDFFCRQVKFYLGAEPEMEPGKLDLSKRTFRNEAHLKRLITGRANYETFFCGSFLFDRIRNSPHSAENGQLPLPEKPRPIHQASAELHCLLGAVVLQYALGPRTVISAYPYAVSKVYDMREYSRASLWGPFMSDGSGNVDWEKVEAIMLVLRYNLRRKGYLRYDVVSAYWNRTFVGSSPGSFRPLIRKMEELPDDTVPLDKLDPYGVTGTWMRLVSFLDYSDFAAYNFPENENRRQNRADNMPRPPFQAEEELRMIIMHIHATKIEMPKESRDEGPLAVNDGPYDNTHPDFPIVHFEGESISMFHHFDANANSGLRGTVRTTREGHIRWTTFSTFNGQPRWRSEGIQIGGRRSGRGVMGNWFDTDYNRRGPCGPTAFWKLHAKNRKKDAITALPNHETDSFAYILTNNDDSLNTHQSARPTWLAATAALAASSSLLAQLEQQLIENGLEGLATMEEQQDAAAEAAEAVEAAAAVEAEVAAVRASAELGSRAGPSASAHVTRGYDYDDEDSDDEDGVFEGSMEAGKIEPPPAVFLPDIHLRANRGLSFFTPERDSALLEAQFIIGITPAEDDMLWGGQDDDDDDDNDDDDDDYDGDEAVEDVGDGE